MKKIHTNNKLAFNKLAVTELNDNQLQAVEGGLTPGIIIGITISIIIDKMLD